MSFFIKGFLEDNTIITIIFSNRAHYFRLKQRDEFIDSIVVINSGTCDSMSNVSYAESHPGCCLVEHCCRTGCDCSRPSNMFQCCYYSEQYGTNECDKPEGCQNTCQKGACCEHCPLP